MITTTPKDTWFNPYKMPTNITIEWLKKENSPFAKICIDLKYHSNAIKELYEKRARLYHEYLISKEWKDKRNELLDIVWHKCEACWSIEKLICHHGSYDKVWYEPLHHLFILCDTCHTEYHSKPELGISMETTEQFITGKLWHQYKKRKR